MRIANDIPESIMLRLDPCRKSILVSILFSTMCSTEHFERLRTTIDPHRAVG